MGDFLSLVSHELRTPLTATKHTRIASAVGSCSRT